MRDTPERALLVAFCEESEALARHIDETDMHGLWSLQAAMSDLLREALAAHDRALLATPPASEGEK
jgi:hypothetical protein